MLEIHPAHSIASYLNHTLDRFNVNDGWATVTLLVMTGIPLAYLVIGKRQGWVSDFETSQRVERPRFILVSLSSDVLALILLTVPGAPYTLRLMALTYLLLGVMMFTISNYWKISLHMVGVSGFSTVLVFVFSGSALVAFLGLPLVAWARWLRRKHTLAQLAPGALITALVFGWLGKIMKVETDNNGAELLR